MSSLTGNKINYLTHTQLNIIKETDDYLLVYDTNHKREELLVISDNLEDAKKYLDLGWKTKKIFSGIIFMAPEIWIVDLADPFKVIKNGGLQENLALYNTFKYFQNNDEISNLINKTLRKNGLNGLKVYLLHGTSLETEVRMAGTDKRIDDFRQLFINTLRESKEFLKEIERIKINYGEKCRRLNLAEKPLDKAALKKYKDISNYYSYIDRDFCFSDNIYGLFKSLPAADNIILIPHSGFKFLDEITKIFDFKKISFYERHFSRDGNFWLFKRNFKNKKVLIIDISYSGETLNTVSEMISREGGTPIRMAVWPKSKLGLANFEYIVFLDKIIKTQSVQAVNPDWCINLYEKIAFE
ncbi:MAG: phosphoribosyltransferase [bacterium]|nr:phosphoribosyltransferase [bacterium]